MVRETDAVANINQTLYCQQQVYLFLAGVKSKFSHYDSNLDCFILNEGVSDFKIEIWRSFDTKRPVLPYRSHFQLVVDIWNGSDLFYFEGKIVDKIEIDTWENEYRKFDKRLECLIYPFFPAKLNSVLQTVLK